MTMLLKGFPPLVPVRPSILILGTIPGERSLQRGEYYAHPRNQFWRLMGDVCGAALPQAYPERVAILQKRGVALWDVLEACLRESSLDSAIRQPVAHDFNAFFQMYPSIRRVVFTSLAAEKLYQKLALPFVRHKPDYRRVPSPSPAFAAMPYEEKLALWKQALKL
jgi:double-stranded uracil-DNA glycosylase